MPKVPRHKINFWGAGWQWVETYLFLVKILTFTYFDQSGKNDRKSMTRGLIRKKNTCELTFILYYLIKVLTKTMSDSEVVIGDR